ncbi:TPA: hypothetical protein ACGV23_000600 [Enterococcus faecium]
MRNLKDWFDISSEVLGCTFVFALILLAIGTLVKLAVVILQAIF